MEAEMYGINHCWDIATGGLLKGNCGGKFLLHISIVLHVYSWNTEQKFFSVEVAISEKTATKSTLLPVVGGA